MNLMMKSFCLLLIGLLLPLGCRKEPNDGGTSAPAQQPQQPAQERDRILAERRKQEEKQARIENLQKDPVASFELFVGSFIASYSERIKGRTEPAVGFICACLGNTVERVGFDVKKTDSLVSPVEGILTFTTKAPLNLLPDTKRQLGGEYNLKFSLKKNGRWGVMAATTRKLTEGFDPSDWEPVDVWGCNDAADMAAAIDKANKSLAEGQ